MIIQTCEMEGYSVLTLGTRCLSCEQKQVNVAPVYPRGRPFVPPAGTSTPGDGASASDRRLRAV
jgi:hypothetical protein